jgi:deoxyribodipyrimidine photo-lyase
MKPIQKLIIPCDRTERLHYIKRMFPKATGKDLSDDWAGGRFNGLKKLNSIDVVAYARNRNFLNGSVTHISPYLRHGCLTLNETYAIIKSQFGVSADKLLYEFAWRDYWRQVWYMEGDRIFSDIESPKVNIGHAPLAYDITEGKTELPCMDAFINDLLTVGYVHNHARMWFASYVVHHRKIDWRAAADWFEAHLLDGDFASNHLSWQWVASTFSSKPYTFNKESLGRYSGERYCANCEAQCPFDADHETLNGLLFNKKIIPLAKKYVITPLSRKVVSNTAAMAIFIHDEMLSSAHILLQQPFPKIFVFDPQIHGTWSLNRLQFVADCLSEMSGVEVWLGDTYDVLISRGVGLVTTQDTPNMKIRELLAPFIPKWQPVEKLINTEMSKGRLKRFSRYWEKAGPLLLGVTKNKIT